MYVDAGSFYNLANNPSFKNLEFRDILSDSIYYTAKPKSHKAARL